MSQTIPVALTIAGSDSSGGAGIQADLKTFSAFGVYGASAITALTAQNTTGVSGVHPVPPAFIVAQIDAVLSDFTVGAAKTGMLATREIVLAVAARLRAVPGLPVVVDPVMIATSGASLIDDGAVEAVRSQLLPLAALVTPNLPEAGRLSGMPEATTDADVRKQAVALVHAGATAVLLKGGHGEGATAIDYLATRDGITAFERPRIATRATHGTGCTLSAAIAALLATGRPLHEAVERAKSYVWQALESGKDLGLGAGHGPLDHLYAIRRSPPPA